MEPIQIVFLVVFVSFITILSIKFFKKTKVEVGNGHDNPPPIDTTNPNPPTFSTLVNSIGQSDANSACATDKTIYIWSYSPGLDDAITYYEGFDIAGPKIPLKVFDGNDLWYSDGIKAVQINSSGTGFGGVSVNCN